MSAIRRVAVAGTDSQIEARRVQELLVRRGYEVVVQALREYRLQGDFDFDSLLPLFVNPEKGETMVDPLALAGGLSTVEIAYRPSVVDPETQSILDAAKLKGVNGLECARCSWLYSIDGVGQEEANRLAAEFLYNPIVEVLVGPGVYEDTLYPTGTPAPLQHYDFTGLTPDQLIQLSREKRWNSPLPQMLVLQERQLVMGRPWTDMEIEGNVQCWSDHCYHTTMKMLNFLRRLYDAIKERNDPLVASFLKGNAGAIHFYEGQILILKGETHNHPFALAALGAILTMVGGLLRDIIFFALGGEVLGVSQIIATRNPSEDLALAPPGAPQGRVLVPQAIAGVRGYCNPSGYPNMGYKYRFDPNFAKPMGLGVAIGFGPVSILDEQEPQEGDYVVLIGGKTGRDGLHGATGSSGNLDAEVVANEAAEVQIGHPIVQRCLADFAIRTRTNVRKRGDLGAGGIICAVSEACEKSGADVDLDKVPLKDQSLAPWEIGESESQERGLDIVPPENLKSYLDDADITCVEATVIGRCRSDGQLTMTRHGEVCYDQSLHWVWGACPIEKPVMRDPEITRQAAVPAELQTRPLTTESFVEFVSDNSLCDQSEAGRQYDQTVQAYTVIGSMINNIIPSGANVYAPLRGKPYGAVYAESFVPRWSKSDPVGSVRANTALAISRAIAIGVQPGDFAGGGNWYVPTRTPEQIWYLDQMTTEQIRLMNALGFSWIVGKDSCSGTITDAKGNKIDVPMTFVPQMVGKMPDVARIRTCLFRRPGDQIFAIRPKTDPNLGGSVALDIFGSGQSDYLLPSPERESDIPALWEAMAESYHLFSSVSAIGEGGAFAQTFFGALGSGLGADLTFSSDSFLWELGGEYLAGFLVTLSDQTPMENSAIAAGVESGNFELVHLGEVTRRPGISVRQGSGQIYISKVRAIPPDPWVEVLSPDDWHKLVHAWKTVFAKEVRG